MKHTPIFNPNNEVSTSDIKSGTLNLKFKIKLYHIHMALF